MDPPSPPALRRTMTARPESAIAAEFGTDDGREMPDSEGIDRTLDRIDL